MALFAPFGLAAATVHFKVTGLEDSDTAIASIASYSYLETMTVSANGDYTFTDVPPGTHYLKIEAAGYISNPSQTVKVSEAGEVIPSTSVKLILTKQSDNPNEWTFKWEEDGSPSGYTQTSHINKPAEIEFLGKKIVPANVPSFSLLTRDYHIYLDNEEQSWTQEYAYRLLETLKTLPINYNNRNYAVFKLTDLHLDDDITINDTAEGYEVLISKDAFYYANPFLVNLDGVRGKLFSKRLHHALTNFVTDYGRDEYAVEQILNNRFGCSILNINYEELTKITTKEDAGRFQPFAPSELVSIINMYEELPEGFHKINHLNYLIRRQNGLQHPLYPQSAAVAWPIENGYIEFMESAFGGNNQQFDTLRLILHEKSHFLWAFTFSDEIKNDWIKTGGWERDADNEWYTTKTTEFVTAYAHAHNPDEDMAESIAFYLKNPEMLQSRSIDKFEFIRDRIMHGTRYVSKIPDHLTFEVLNLNPDYDYPGKIKRTEINISGAPDEDKIVTIEIELNDEEGFDDGASHAYIAINSPIFTDRDGKDHQQVFECYMYPLAENDHILRGSTTISKYSKSGHWVGGDIIVTDKVGNQRFEGRNDCVTDFYINNSLEDLEAPVYGGDLRYIVTDTVLDGRNAQNLQVRCKISENIGFLRIAGSVNREGTDYSLQADGRYDEETGEAIIDFPITEFFPTGDYWLCALHLWDLAGSETRIWYTESDSDYPVQKVHITTSNPDIQHAELDLQRINLYAEPTHPEAPDGETLVTINFYARDDKSGLGHCSYTLRDPQGIQHFQYYYHRNFYTTYFDGDPTVWERYSIKCILPQGSAPGIWGLEELCLVDKATNAYTYNFVETLIFEPDDNLSDYELFANIKDDTLSFGLNSQSNTTFGFKWRIIHEDSGLEIDGDSNTDTSETRPTIKFQYEPGNEIHTDLADLPGGDLILIVQILNESGDVVSVKTQRLTYEGPKVLAEYITLTPYEWQGELGDSFVITAYISPENTTDKTLIWSSSNENVATVDADGKVTTLSVGMADITATCGDVSARCKVTVNPVTATEITLNFEDMTLLVGQSDVLIATVLPENTTDKTITWKSDDNTVATISEDGTVTATAVGVANITATCVDISATCKVTVQPILVELLTISTTNWNGMEGESFKITAIVEPENATDKTLVWRSSDPSIANVDDTGLVTIRKAGCCKISVSTVDGSNLIAECIITGLSGIESLFRDVDTKVEVYSLTGILIKSECSLTELRQFGQGVYIIRNNFGTKTILIN